MNYNYPMNCNCDAYATGVLGTSIDLNTEHVCASELRADIIVEEFKSIRVWGQIVNCQGQPVSGAMLKLVKLVCCGHDNQYHGIAHTVSDCNGFYQFDLCDAEPSCYKIIVTKAVNGPEVTIEPTTGSCATNCIPNPANGGSSSYPLCAYPSVTIPPMGPCSCPPHPHPQPCPPPHPHPQPCPPPHPHPQPCPPVFYDYSQPYSCK